MDHFKQNTPLQQVQDHKVAYLHRIVQNNHLELLKALLNHYYIGIDAIDENRWTPLDWAVKEGNVEITKLLLKNKASISENIKYLVQKENTLNTEILKLLLLKSLEDETELITDLLRELKRRHALQNDTDYCIQILYGAGCVGALKKVLYLSDIPHELLNETTQDGKIVIHLLIDQLTTIKQELNQVEKMETKQFLENRIQNVKDAICYLIQEGSDVRKADSKGQTPYSLLQSLGKDGQDILNLFKTFEKGFRTNALLKEKRSPSVGSSPKASIQNLALTNKHKYR